MKRKENEVEARRKERKRKRGEIIGMNGIWQIRINEQWGEMG